MLKESIVMKGDKETTPNSKDTVMKEFYRAVRRLGKKPKIIKRINLRKSLQSS